MGSSVTHFAQHPSTLAHNLATRAERHGERDAVAFTSGDNHWSSISYAELAGRASALAELLRSLRRPSGDPQFVLIMLPNSIEYVVSFYGCLVAGAVGVPFYPPTVLTSRTSRAFSDRLRQICRDCRPSVIVLPANLVDFVRSELDTDPVLIAAEGLPDAASTMGPIFARPSDLALLQYTSGSTMQPKGVMVTHANLVHNVHAFAAMLGSRPGESIATWLPLFHDMGLIGTILHPLATGMTIQLTTPVAFARRPFLWLDMASASRASVIMAPNFAYDLCVRSVSEEQRATLDLSAIRAAVNGAEQVRHTTIDAFVKAYERYGFRPSAMMSGYGLAEATLYVTVDDWRHEPTLLEVSAARLRDDGVAVPAEEEPSTVLASCGPDIADSETVIVDPDRLVPCSDGCVGEIWVTGPSVAVGYWNQPDLSEQTFAAELAQDGRQYVRTGDLGVKVDGALYVVGRLKDMIVQRGVNHSPQDVEFTAERAHPALRPGGTAVFTVPGDAEERVVVLCELHTYANRQEFPGILRAVRAAVTEEHGLEIGTVAVVRKGQIPKTTSGKVRRRASADQWLAREFDTLAAIG
jgi:acyl-CoA synthetase (AMP-forming)/AMP-acid ligase II